MIVSFISEVIDFLVRAFNKVIRSPYYTSRLGECGKNVFIKKPIAYAHLERVFMEDNTHIDAGFVFMSNGGKFIMKKNSGAACGLTVVTGTHVRTVGQPFKKGSTSHSEKDTEKDVIVGEDVWIGTNVTLLSGVVIGRGATLGAGAVCSKSVPPYAIVVGNPAKVVGFSFTPSEIEEHEKELYPEEERIPIEQLEKNYEKFFLKRLKEIKEHTKI